jgi:hypothetical protein
METRLSFAGLNVLPIGRGRARVRTIEAASRPQKKAIREARGMRDAVAQG